LHLRILKKHRLLKKQGGPHSALPLIWHWKLTVYHFRNIEQQNFNSNAGMYFFQAKVVMLGKARI